MTATTRRGLLAAAVGRRSDGQLLADALAAAQLAAYCDAHVLAELDFAVPTRGALQELLAHNQAHAQALATAVTRAGGHAPAAPASDASVNQTLSRSRVAQRLGQLRGVSDGLALLITIERLAVGACYAALIGITDPASARLTASVMASGAQHEAVLYELLHPGDIAGAIPYGLVQGLQ